MKPASRILVALALVAIAARVTTAQEVVRTGPPPEVRTLIDSLVKAANGTGDAWEAFAQERFTPALLKQQSAAERRKAHAQLRTSLGTITFDRAMREGPEAPLELQLSGSTGASAILSLGLHESAAPKISSFKSDVKAKGKAAE